MDLRTRYTALVTLMTQYMKFAGDSLKRLEEEEVTVNKLYPCEQELGLRRICSALGRKITFMMNLHGSLLICKSLIGGLSWKRLKALDIH